MMCKQCLKRRTIGTYTVKTTKNGKTYTYIYPVYWCRQCAAKKQRLYRKANIQRYRDSNNATNRKRYNDIILVNKNMSCMDCRIKYNPWQMDFDHRPGEVKLYNISQSYTNVAKTKLLTEIKKCDVVCANCHRNRTHYRKINGPIN